MSLNKPIKYLFFYSTFHKPFFRRSQRGNQKAPSTLESASHILIVPGSNRRPELIPINPIQQKIIIFTSRFDEKASHVLI